MSETPITIDELLTEREWLTRLARHLVADSGTADDLVQETWLTALTRPPHHRRGIRGWLATVLRNRARDEWDREQRADRRVKQSAPVAPPDDPADIVARAELEQRVARLTLALPEPYRTTLVMRTTAVSVPAKSPGVSAIRRGLSAAV